MFRAARMGWVYHRSASCATGYYRPQRVVALLRELAGHLYARLRRGIGRVEQFRRRHSASLPAMSSRHRPAAADVTAVARVGVAESERDLAHGRQKRPERSAGAGAPPRSRRPLRQKQLTARGRAGTAHAGGSAGRIVGTVRHRLRGRQQIDDSERFSAEGSGLAPAPPRLVRLSADRAYGQWITTTGRGVTHRRSKGTRTGRSSRLRNADGAGGKNGCSVTSCRFRSRSSTASARPGS
jgi:hypothetical protein